jgi:hypothetical protein
MPFGLQSASCGRRSAFGVWRLAFGVRRLAVGGCAQRSVSVPKGLNDRSPTPLIHIRDRVIGQAGNQKAG